MYRNLLEYEIANLEKRNCSSSDWSLVKVKGDILDVERFANVRFSGKVNVGVLENDVELIEGIFMPASIKNAHLHNCTIGDNVYINNVSRFIANYTIGADVIINNIGSLVVNKGSRFGNGTKVSVLNETGGRDVPIYDKLSSQLAYLIALYRHRGELISSLFTMIEAYADEVCKKGARIGNKTQLINCGEVTDVCIGDGAQIRGVSRLFDGSINSTMDAPVLVGQDVIAEHFIICNGSKVFDGAIIDKCFVGQGTEIGKQYSAENSLFFANCVAMHGEACAIFAGPYTVTHHKSTLLIAIMCSFMNAGSGSNQSNHMYKLGPIHQGVLERGSKTTSGSYVLLPMKVGTFSLVMGRHYTNADLSNLPFSYIIENKENVSVVVPGMNLRSVGTIRDAKKWSRRDKRQGKVLYDNINFNLLSPYTVSKMLKGESLLKQILSDADESTDHSIYQGCILKNSSARRGLKMYHYGITKFLGNALIKRLETVEWESIEQIRQRLKPSQPIGKGEWIDVSGLITPKSEITRILNSIEDNTLSNLEQIGAAFNTLNQHYDEFEWNWAVEEFGKQIGKSIEEIELDDLLTYVKHWKECVVALDEELYEDTRKEFTPINSTSFGIDGNQETKEKDFIAVRGEFEKNDFVVEVLNHIKRKSSLADEFLQRIGAISFKDNRIKSSHN